MGAQLGPGPPVLLVHGTQVDPPRLEAQVDGRVSEVMALEPLRDKWSAFGWHVIEIDGHKVKEIVDAFCEAKDTEGKPTIIIAKTIKGKGVSFMENVADFHGRTPNGDETKKALEELELAP